MSLILDALKRSEGERQEKAGSITVSNYPTAERQRPRWIPITLGALLLVNILAISWLLFGNRKAAPMPPAAKSARVTPAQPKAVTTQPTVQPSHRPKPIPTEPAAQPPRALGMHRPGHPQPRPQTATTTATVPKAVSPVTPLPKRPLAAELARPAPRPAAKATVQPTTTDPIQPVSDTPSRPRPTEPAPPVMTTPKVVTHQPTPKPTHAVPTIDEADPAVRSKLSAYEINAHVYSDDPLKRFVLINLQRFQEGDTLPGSNFKLIEIRPDGIVIDDGQGKVLMPASSY